MLDEIPLAVLADFKISRYPHKSPNSVPPLSLQQAENLVEVLSDERGRSFIVSPYLIGVG